MAREHHRFQSEAISRLQVARTLLAEAAGLMRACERNVKEEVDLLGPGLLDPEQQAREIEEAESRVGRAVLSIIKAPVGGKVV